MANKNLFKSMKESMLNSTDARNEAGAPAYQMKPEHALAQYVATGCLNSTFYATAEEQLKKVLELSNTIDPLFIAQTAVFCREQGYMKDMPALLCAVLSIADTELLKKVFPRVIDNGKMLRNFVQMVRSGVVGRKSLGTAPKKLILQWIESRTDEQLFYASVGNDPSLADIIRMVHPQPKTKTREALFGYLLGKPYKTEHLPEIVANYERFKSGQMQEVPKVPMEMLTALELPSEGWKEITRRASWLMTMMNLNAFARHGVFESASMVNMIANRLRDPEAVKKAKVFPYKIMVAYAMSSVEIPKVILSALEEAMEISLENVPKIKGPVVVCPDVSGSMSSAVTGYRKGSTSAVRCIDVAALVAGAVIARNHSTDVMPFAEDVRAVKISARDSVMTNANKLAALGGGGTNCSAPLGLLNQRKSSADVVIFVSDNQSWMDANRDGSTQMMYQWDLFKKRNPEAKLICIDLQPYGTTQALERKDIFNIGGFSDLVFTNLASFVEGRLDSDHWVGLIKEIKLN